MLHLNSTLLELAIQQEHRNRVRAAERRRMIEERIHNPGPTSRTIGSIRDFVRTLANPDARQA